jgi:sugar phosphate isomerase/epimerase
MMNNPSRSDALLSTCWTSAGDVMPIRNGDRSSIDIRDRVAAAAAAGFTGFGLAHSDLVVIRDSLGYAALADLFVEHGMTTVELEYADDWWTTGPRREAADRVRADLLDVAQSLGASHIKAGAGQRDDVCEPDRLREEFARLATDAANAGTRIALEPGAFSMMSTIAPAADLVRELDHPAGGLLVDIWHVYRSGMSYTEMKGVLPAGHLFAVEINDGKKEVIGTLYEDTFDNRLYCGQGDFDTAAFVRAIRDLGYNGHWGVEMMSIEHRTLDVWTATERAAGAAATLLAGVHQQG